MVIPLTLEVLILREKKNKRKTMMNNIKNTMCRLADLTQEQIDSLVIAMPSSPFLSTLRRREGFSKIGFSGTDAGFWNGRVGFDTILTYAEMMQLLKGNNMNKQTAQEQMAVMQIEMDKLKAIIDRPEAKTGRVMSGGELELNARYWYVWNSVKYSVMDSDRTDKALIDTGSAFHDKQSAERHLEYLKLEQELRRAKITDGGEGAYILVLSNSGLIHKQSDLINYHKICFNTHSARKAFRTAHTDEQLTLLIRGV
jgi:hypothetical protein